MSPTEQALIELCGAFSEMEHYQDLPAVHHKILKKYLRFDWMIIFSWEPSGQSANISMSIDLPMDWHARFHFMAGHDHFIEKIFSAPCGQAVIFEDLAHLCNSDNLVGDTCQKSHKAVHLMGMATENKPQRRSVIGICRTDSADQYTMAEKRFFMQLGPALRSSIKMMQVCRRWELMRLGYDGIFKSEEILPLIVDVRLNIISNPPSTRKFLQTALGDPSLTRMPEFVTRWIKEEILPECQSKHPSGLWQTVLKGPSRDIICLARLLSLPHKPPMLIITFKQDEVADDFKILSRSGLTEREIEALSFLPLGYTNKQIAAAMEISVSGVKKHLKNVGKKLDAVGRAETLFRAICCKQELAKN